MENLIMNKFRNFGIMKGNFELFWHDDKDDFNVIQDNGDLSEALEELDGPVYELIACFLSKGNQGKKLILRIVFYKKKTFTLTSIIVKNHYSFF